MPAKRHPRPQIQRAFLSWLNENQTHFGLPIRITKITAKAVELRFLNYPECLSVWLTGNELGVHVEWQEDYWDCLIDLDVSPIHTLDGYQCKHCATDNAEEVIVFSSLEALWKDHLFEPFLKWVNEKLAPARWLSISSSDCVDYEQSAWMAFDGKAFLDLTIVRSERNGRLIPS